MSLSGYYGPDAQSKAKQLIEGGVVHYACTDIHKVFQLNELEKVLKSPLYKRLIEADTLQNAYLRKRIS